MSAWLILTRGVGQTATPSPFRGRGRKGKVPSLWDSTVYTPEQKAKKPWRKVKSWHFKRHRERYKVCVLFRTDMCLPESGLRWWCFEIEVWNRVSTEIECRGRHLGCCTVTGEEKVVRVTSAPSTSIQNYRFSSFLSTKSTTRKRKISGPVDHTHCSRSET